MRLRAGRSSWRPARRGAGGWVERTGRRDGDDGGVFLESPGLLFCAPAPPPVAAFGEAEVRTWLLPRSMNVCAAGSASFWPSCRPTVACFCVSPASTTTATSGRRQAGCLIRWVQAIVQRYEGTLIDLNIGDKGSYIYVNFGAPWPTKTTPPGRRNCLELRKPPPDLDFIRAVQIGMSQGRMRAGAYGGAGHRTYGVLGDHVNLAARLMMAADPGQVLVSHAAQRPSRTIHLGESAGDSGQRQERANGHFRFDRRRPGAGDAPAAVAISPPGRATRGVGEPHRTGACPGRSRPGAWHCRRRGHRQITLCGRDVHEAQRRRLPAPMPANARLTASTPAILSGSRSGAGSLGSTQSGLRSARREARESAWPRSTRRWSRACRCWGLC